MNPPRPRLPFAALPLSVVLISGLHAAGSSAPSSAPVTANYTDNPVSSSVTSTSPSYSYSYSYASPSYPYSGSWPAFVPQRTYVRDTVYYPPAVPALGQSVPRKPTASRGYNVPARLETYVSEPFFAPLSVRLFREDLPRRRAERIENYRSEKAVLLAELRSVLDSTKDATPADRQAALASLANRQDPRLRELAAAAEEIREELTRGGFLESSVSWNDYRDWRLGDNTRYETVVDEFKVVRAAAYFQRGLNPAQRRLLREIAMELNEQSFSSSDPTALIALDAPGRYYYFSPATARIRLPSELAPDVRARVEQYREKKDALKRELRSTLYRLDSAWFGVSRNLNELAAKQAPALAELDVLAEQLRRDLSAYPYPDEPPKSGLSDDLVGRISRYLNRRTDLQREMLARLQEVKTALPSDRVEFLRRDGGYALEVVPNKSASREVRRNREKILPTLPVFNADKIARYRQLDQERDALRAEVGQIVASSSRNGARTVDELLRNFAYAFEKQERWALYREYRIAVLEPGLSAAQRELLFDATLEELMAYSPLVRL